MNYPIILARNLTKNPKSGFLCQKRRFFPGFGPFQAQNQHFCAREEGKVESESVTAETLTLPANHRARFQNANTS